MQSATQFIAFMVRVWDDADDYDEWHNAAISAGRLGGRKVSAQCRDDEDGYVFVFPDGSYCWVAAHGARVQKMQLRLM